MKKAFILTILLAIAVSSFAQELPNRLLFIEGNAIRPAQTEFFLTNFRLEATSAGYTLTSVREEAGFIFRFEVTNNPDAAIDGNQYAIRISLINNSNNFEILYFYFYFNTLEEMYEHNQYLLFRAVSVIPPLTEEAILKAESKWKHKWVYLRASVDYPVNMYRLQPTGLVNDIWVYYGPYDNPTKVSDLDHKVIVLPGITLGAEAQFLDFMSFELNFKAHMGDFDTNYFLNLMIQGQLKFPIKKLRPFVISPYIAGAIPVLWSKDVFSEYPSFFFGGGVQFNIRGGKYGALFLDLNLMTTLTDAERKNPYGTEFPNPSVIHYRPFFVGIGIGYKFGLKDRPEKSVNYRFVCNCGCGTEMPSPPSETENKPGASEPRDRRERESASRTFYF